MLAHGTSSSLRLPIQELSIHLATVANRNHENHQLTIVDFVDDTLIANAHAPRWPAFEFLHVVRSRIGFERAQADHDPRGHIIRRPVQLLLDRLWQDDPIPHFRFWVRLNRYSANVTNWPNAISACTAGCAVS